MPQCPEEAWRSLELTRKNFDPHTYPESTTKTQSRWIRSRSYHCFVSCPHYSNFEHPKFEESQKTRSIVNQRHHPKCWGVLLCKVPEKMREQPVEVGICNALFTGKVTKEQSLAQQSLAIEQCYNLLVDKQMEHQL